MPFNADLAEKLFRRSGVILIQLYLVFLGWTDAFSVSSWFPLHVVLLTMASILFLPYMPIFLSGKKLLFPASDLMLVFALLLYFGAAITNWNDKTLNYIAAYGYTFIIGYWGLKILMSSLVTREQILNANLAGILLVSLYAVLEVSIESISGVDIQSYIPRHRETTATFLHGMIPRAYGMATEPTILVMYINTLGPLAWWHIARICPYKRSVVIFVRGAIFLAWIATFSVGGYVFMLLAISIAFIAHFIISQIRDIRNASNVSRFKDKRYAFKAGVSKNTLVFLLAIIALLSLSQISVVKDYAFLAAQAITSKASLSDKNPSASIRKHQWSRSVETIINTNGMPVGPGSTSSAGSSSSLNWYLFVALEGGVYSAIAFILFLVSNGFLIMISDIEAKYYILVGFIASVLHLTIVSTFYHPFLWVLIAIFHVFRMNSANQKRLIYTAGNSG